MKINEVVQEVETRVLFNKGNLDIIRRDCSQILQSGTAIYKGVRNIDPDTVLFNPAAGNRKSKNNANYYTLLIDNLPIWSKFPKRSKSLICTNSLDSALQYGSVYRVLPLNDAKFGICPTFDIWASFNISLKNQHVKINRIFYSVGINDDNYASFLKDILINKDKICQIMIEQGYPTLSDELKSVKNINGLIRMFQMWYNPVVNDFKLANNLTLSGVHGSVPIEVWTDSKCYMIRAGSPAYIELFDL